MLKNISQTLRQQISTSSQKANRVNERLSSGKRANRAADDAAALALSCRSKAKAASIERANRNIGEVCQPFSTLTQVPLRLRQPV